MNIQTLQASLVSTGKTRPRGRLDIRSDAPAQPSRPPVGRASGADPLEGAGLLNVLNAQEQQALAAAFSQEKAPTYSGGGTTVDEPTVLGTQLDLRA